MSVGGTRHRGRETMWVLALVSSSVVAADLDLRKPAPDAEAQPYRERLETIIGARYPKLLTEKVAGTPVVTVLFDPHGDLIRAELTLSRQPAALLSASEEQFSRFGVASGRLRYIGAGRVQLPLNTVLVVFGGMDSQDVDRALVKLYFPTVLIKGASGNMGIWILFDHDGRVVRSGEEPFEPSELRTLLEERYAGIKTSSMTVAPVLGENGRPIRNSSQQTLQLHCVWLAVGSPLP